MTDQHIRTPVAFFIFNRPETTKRVFAEIAKAKPSTLLVVADGPRKSRASEAQSCALTREVIERVDWPCQVLTNFSDVNLGCRARVSSGLDWIFEQVPEAIILEDDCVPHPTFFQFCQELLKRYRDDERVGMISGNNFQFGQRMGSGSYYFSKYPHIWGWASWRRAWKHYDVTASCWPEFLASGRLRNSTLPCERDSWELAFSGVHERSIDTWDYQWTLACWSQSMMSVLPEVNLVTNIGFGEDATHTLKKNLYANLPVEAMQWPLVEPRISAPHALADARTAEGMFKSTFRKKIKLGLRRASRSVSGRSETDTAMRGLESKAQ